MAAANVKLEHGPDLLLTLILVIDILFIGFLVLTSQTEQINQYQNDIEECCYNGCIPMPTECLDAEPLCKEQTIYMNNPAEPMPLKGTLWSIGIIGGIVLAAFIWVEATK
jgi:hypothetical protein